MTEQNTSSHKAELIALIAKLGCYKEVEIELSQRLYHDLSFSGDDAWELMEMIGAKFGTKFDGFDFERYFYNEGDDSAFLILRWFGIKGKKDPLTVAHLLRVVESGSWFDPDEQR